MVSKRAARAPKPLATESRAYRNLYGMSQPIELRDVYRKEIVQDIMKRNAADYRRRMDRVLQLDYKNFCDLVRAREPGGHTQEELKHRFDEIDRNKNGKISLEEYVVFALRDAL